MLQLLTLLTVWMLPERQSRELIDQQLARAGWGSASRLIREEFRLPGREPVVGESASQDEIPDYVLTDAHQHSRV
jgi:type I site-specific restriction endonuclease